PSPPFPYTTLFRTARPRPAEDLFQERGAHCPDGDGIQRLPIGPAEARLASFPKGAADRDGEGSVREESLVAALPDSAVVVGEPVIDAERAAARLRLERGGHKEPQRGTTPHTQ